MASDHTVSFDTETGRLRTTPDLLGHAAQAFLGKADANYPQEYVAAGAISQGTPHPILELGLQAVVAPECQLLVQVAGPGGYAVHHGWLRPDAAAVLLQVDDTVSDLVVVPPEFIASTVHRLLALGPTPALQGGHVAVDPVVLAELIQPDAETREGALSRLISVLPPEWQAWGGAFADGDWCAWSARMSWTDPAGGQAGRVVVAVSNEAGTLEVYDIDDDHVQLGPTTSTRLWIELICLLPVEGESRPVESKDEISSAPSPISEASTQSR